jgi:putative sigma-54 modulation protein
MTKSVSAVGFTFEKDQSDLIEQKLGRIAYADDLIVDLMLRVKEDKKYYFDATVNFRWGANAHVTSDDYEFAAGLNKLMDVLDLKIKKEKDKVQEKGK